VLRGKCTRLDTFVVPGSSFLDLSRFVHVLRS
jgi:hypothetical protein